jgi:hypothetical protein
MMHADSPTIEADISAIESAGKLMKVRIYGAAGAAPGLCLIRVQFCRANGAGVAVIGVCRP